MIAYYFHLTSSLGTKGIGRSMLPEEIFPHKMCHLSMSGHHVPFQWMLWCQNKIVGTICLDDLLHILTLPILPTRPLLVAM